MSRWVREGSHRLEGWTAMLPSQTSASQAGILHGNNDGIPAFRWYEKKTNKLMVSNHPRGRNGDRPPGLERRGPAEQRRGQHQ